jgi:hypothetical protein
MRVRRPALILIGKVFEQQRHAGVQLTQVSQESRAVNIPPSRSHFVEVPGPVLVER